MATWVKQPAPIDTFESTWGSFEPNAWGSKLEKQCKVWSMGSPSEIPTPQKKDWLMVSSHSKRHAHHSGWSKVIQSHQKAMAEKMLRLTPPTGWRISASPSWPACDLFQLAVYVVLLSVAPRDETGKLRSCSGQRCSLESLMADNIPSRVMSLW